MSPRLPPGRGPDAPGPGPGPAPIGPRPPRPPFPPIPWTPFGPGDNATPDVDAIVSRTEEIRIALEKAQLELTAMRYGPGPDGTPPVVREVTRADGLWPFLVIRTYPGDMGKRPIEPGDTTPYYAYPVNSPDVVFTPPGPTGEPTVVGRSGIAAIKDRELDNLIAGEPYDVWVHVWNLGLFQATGVRVRVQQSPTTFSYGGPQPSQRLLGGVTIDLGDRASDTAHLMVKTATFTTDVTGDDYRMLVIATAECLTDPGNGIFGPGGDRHSAHRAPDVSS